MAGQVKLQQDSIVLLGAGYTARALIASLRARGLKIFATSRDGRDLKMRGVTSITFNGAPNAQLTRALQNARYILSSIAPHHGGDPALRAYPDIANLAQNCEWAGYLSATSVYGDRRGKWAFEDELLAPKTARGRRRADAEIAWIESGAPVHIFRLAGIYGPGRSPFQKIINGTARAIMRPGHVSNRVHVDDIVCAILASMDAPNPQRIYNIADDSPAPPQDVVAHAADLLGAKRPAKISANDPSLSDLARSFYGENKRISTARIKHELDWTPQYPSYHEGLPAALKAEKLNPLGVTLTGHIEIAQGELQALQDALPEHIRASQDEPGCLHFSVRQDVAVPTRYHVYERFMNRESYLAHQSRIKNTPWETASRNIVRHYNTYGA
jgi:nucleoside-diphosphate-sugar epimerase/quinol monooxygenase YgiN